MLYPHGPSRLPLRDPHQVACAQRADAREALELGPDASAPGGDERDGLRVPHPLDMPLDVLEQRPHVTRVGIDRRSHADAHQA
ncbi:MAG: hypothetical protein M5T61_01905 [Acidimicrobiia bacterium]|nr:hypothetical protein [Acidimicrobiia bacterium]